MTFSISDYFPLKGAQRQGVRPGMATPNRRAKVAAASGARRNFTLETVEPRILLSADVYNNVTLAAYVASPFLGAGVYAEAHAGLGLVDDVGTDVQSGVDYIAALATHIPGLLARADADGNAILNPTNYQAPTLGEVLATDVATFNDISSAVATLLGSVPGGQTAAQFATALEALHKSITVVGSGAVTIDVNLLDADPATGGLQPFLLKSIGGADYEFLYHLEVVIGIADDGTTDTYSLDPGRNADALEIAYGADTPFTALPQVPLETRYKVETIVGVAATIVQGTYDADPGAGVNLQPQTTVTPTGHFLRDPSFSAGVGADVTTPEVPVLRFGFLDVKATAGTAMFDMHVAANYSGTFGNVGALTAATPSFNPGGSIDVVLPIAVDPAGVLGGGSFGADAPAIHLFTTDPFADIHDPVGGSNDHRTAIQIELQNFGRLNPFRNIDDIGLANVFAGLSTLLTQLESKAELFGLKLPLVDATKISDALRFEGPMKELFTALTKEVNGVRVANFNTVQDFVAKLQAALNTLLGTYNALDLPDAGALVGVNPRYVYDPLDATSKPTLLFTIQLHGGTVDKPIKVEGDLGLDLGALGDVAVTGSLLLDARFDTTLTLGIELVEAPDVAITTEASAPALVSRVFAGTPANPATFSLVLGGVGSVQVTVPAGSATPAALASALDSAISAAIAAAVASKSLAFPTDGPGGPVIVPRVTVIANLQGRIEIASDALPYLQIVDPVDPALLPASHVAFATLGFYSGQRASSSSLPVDGRLSGDASFELTIGSNAHTVIVHATDAAALTTPDALVALVNAAIVAQFGAGTYATIVGNEVVGRQIRLVGGGAFVRVDAVNPVARAELGLLNDAVSSKLRINGDGAIVFKPDPADPVPPALPVSGNLASPLTFTVELKQGGVSSGAIAVSATLAGNQLNAQVQPQGAAQAAADAARDINKALAAASLSGGQKLGSVLVAIAVERHDTNGVGTGVWAIQLIQPGAALDSSLAFAFADSIAIAGLGAGETIGLADDTVLRNGPGIGNTLSGPAQFTVNLTNSGGVVTQQVLNIAVPVNNTLPGVVDAINAALGPVATRKVTAGLEGARIVFAVTDASMKVIELSSVNAVARDALGLQEGISAREFDGLQSFVQDVHLDASLAFTGSASGTANFGFVSLNLGTATASLNASVEVDLADAAGQKIYVKDIFNAFGRPVGAPGGLIAVLEGAPPNGDMIGKLVGFGPGANEEIDLRGSASLNWDGAAITVAGAGGVAADLAGELGEVVAPSIHITLPDITQLNTLTVDANLGSIGDLSDFSFDDVIAALRGIADWLKAYVQKIDIVNEPLPLLGISLAQTLDFVDDFLKTVDDIASNPTHSLQSLVDRVNEGLQRFAGPAASIGYQAHSPGILTFSLGFKRAFSDILPLNLDMVELLQGQGITVPGLELNGAANLAADFSLDALLVFGVNVAGLSAALDDPVHAAADVFGKIFLVVEDADAENIAGYTHLKLSAYAAAENVTFTGALGPLGLFVTNGGAVLNSDGILGHTGKATIDITLPDLGANDGYLTLSELFNGANAAAIFSPDRVEVHLGVAAVLPISFPTSSSFIGNLDFSATVTDPFSVGGVTYKLNSIPDFSKIDLGSLSLLDTINLFLAGADTVLGTLGDLITGKVFGASDLKDLPLVGNALDDAGAFIDQIRNEVIPRITAAIETAPELAADIFRQVGQILQDAIGGLGFLDTTIKLEFRNGATPTLFDFGGPVNLAALTAAVTTADSFAYVIDLGVDLKIEAKDVNLNLEVFQLALTKPITVDISADFTFGIGVSLEDGFFFQVNPLGTPDLSGSIEINLPKTVDAQLFFIELIAENNNFGVRPDLAAGFSVDVLGTDADGRIGFGDLGGLGFDVDFGATVDLDLLFKLGFSGSTGVTLPKILADFDFAWGFGDVIVPAGHFGVDAGHPDKPLLELGNIRMDIGSFLGDTIGPFITEVYDVIEPIDPILDILTNPIPVLSDLLGPTSLLDVAATFGIVSPGLVTALETLDQIVDFAATVSEAGNGYLTLFAGTLSFGGSSGMDLTDMNQVGGLTDPSKALGSVLNALAASGIVLPSGITDALSFIASGIDTSALGGVAGGGLTAPSGGFSFPFLEHPEEVLGLFFGRNMTLVAYDLPPLEFGFDFSIYVPIWDGLGARFAGGINAIIDLAFGYDTEGIFRFASGGHNPLDLVQGFFVYDDNPFTGTPGLDVPEVLITGEITAAAELNLVVASAGVGGGIFAEVGFDLADPDGDYRVRLDEIIANLVNGFDQGVGPLGLFDVDAKIEAHMFAYIKAMFGLWSKEFQFGPSLPLYEEHYEVPHDPVLATDMGNGTLRLNIGDFATDRIYTSPDNGADDPVDGDEQLQVEIISKNEIRVRGAGPDFSELAADDWQTFKRGGDGFTLVLGFAGLGDDEITINDLTAGTVRVELHGGAGADELHGGNAADLLIGEAGEDHLIGGAGNDRLEGGAGDDCLEGGAGLDTLYGGAGSDVLVGGADRDVLLGEDGDDVISGGSGDDTALGGAGADLIAGGAGADVLMGNAGNDRIWGDLDFAFVDCVLTLAPGNDEPLFAAPVAEGADLISGGGGSDEIQGNGANDSIWGDSTFRLDPVTFAVLTTAGKPQLLLPEFGNFGADNLSGGAGNDTIYGEAGNDVIRGDNVRVNDTADNDANPFTWVEGDRFSRGTPHGGTDGNDVLYGGRDSDIVYGNGGNDTIAGGTENDILFGNAGNDTITGDVGADVIFGDSGQVVVWLAGNDLDGLPGGDTYAAPTQDFRRLESNTEALDGDDTIDAGQDNDIVFGGGGVGLQASNPAVGQTIEDLIKAGSGDDIVFGDHGQVLFTFVKPAGAAYATLLTSVDKDFGGSDQIFGSTGRDVLVGGKGGDFVYGDDAPTPDPDSRDVLAGDHIQMTQQVLLVAVTPSAVVADVYAAVPLRIVSNETAPAQGGNDTLDGGQDDDFLIGGPGDDRGTGGTGNDVLLGDRGQIDFDLSFIVAATGYAFNKGEQFVLKTVFSTDLVALTDIPFTGVDRLSGGDGNDVVIGGGRGDFLYGDAELSGSVGGPGINVSDILVGDNGQVDYLQHGKLARVFTIDAVNETGGNDTIEGNAGVDIALGGVGSDTVFGGGDTAAARAGDGDDILLGDNGKVDFSVDLGLTLVPTGVTPINLGTLDRIESFLDGRGAGDTISGNAGGDVAMGGTGDDTIYGDDAGATSAAADGADMLLGDNGLILLVNPALDTTLPAGATDRRFVRGGAVALLRSTDEADTGGAVADAGNPLKNTGGRDTVSGNAGGDVVLGGVRGDFLYGDRAAPTVASNANDGNDTLLGDNGALEWLSTGRLGDLPAVVAAGDARWNDLLDNAFATRDIDLDTLDLITTEQPTQGGRDLIYGDNGRDAVFGGTDADTIYGDSGDDGVLSAGNANDLLFGDHGRLYAQLSRLTDIHSRDFFSIATGQGDGGEGDRIWGEEGMDILLGQQGDDRLWGGSGDDDLIGGHNVEGGADELTLTTISITSGADAWNDLMDGGSENDVLAGDNSVVWRTGLDTNPRFRVLPGATLYTTTETTVTVNVTSDAQQDPDDTNGRFVFLLNHDKGANTGLFGADVMAGGAQRDMLFGELGNDLMQGDGMIADLAGPAGEVGRTLVTADTGPAPSTGGTAYFRVPEQASDGDDYLEGNGGNDTMYGGLGQDDMIGGSSSLFGLDPGVLLGSAKRPDGSDRMWGGAGIQTGRGDLGHLMNGVTGADPAGTAAETAIASERGRDSDSMLGDNGNIYRIVKPAPADGPGETRYVRFDYDALTPAYTGGTLIVVRSTQSLDYTLGGPDFDQNTATAALDTTQGTDNGAGDFIHGEAGNDFIQGMAGSDILFGDAHDDDIVGGYGHDWISGGTGQDGVIGDDGIVRTSRNSQTGEALFGVAGLLLGDPNSRESNGNVLDELISTPGNIQRAVINATGELAKAMDLTPLSVDARWDAVDDEFGYAGLSSAGPAPFADDIIYGGLGSDWLHGGSGDDAISGAEALTVFFSAANAGTPSAGTLGGSSVNQGNELRFNPLDVDGKAPTRERAGEFALYDEYTPLRQIKVSSADGWSGSLVTSGGSDFILNFDENEGVLRLSETVPTNGPNTIVTGDVHDDGSDRIFGDVGNDWLVGGTGRDDVYGGWGNDLLNVDDDQTTNNAPLNDTPDTHSTYEDRAYGGAGRDVLIANTGGDRLIDWVGEWNSYLVPFAPFGMATVSRTLQPQLPEFLYALSRADGADPTIVADGNGSAARNGEPFGELGLVLQKDAAWQDQTGAPSDPQAGNIPGGRRDVLRSADFNNQQGQGFVAESGTWSITSGKYEVAPSATSTNKDAISLYFTGEPIPMYFEVAATINAIKPTGGFKANAYLIFDYVSPTDFKFAGLDISTNKIEIGQRASWGFQVLASTNAPLKAGQDYNLLLAVNGNAVTLVVDNALSVSHAFTPRVDSLGTAHPIRDAMIGLGGDNARARIDDVRLQILPPTYTYLASDAFDAAPTLVAPTKGSWSQGAGRLIGTPTAAAAIALADNSLAVDANAAVQVDAKFSLTAGAIGGITFDKYSDTDFKWVGLSATTKQLLVGHYTAKAGWVVDLTVARPELVTGVDHTLGLSLKGSTVNITLNGGTVISRVFNAAVVDGAVGTFAKGGAVSFDSFALKTDSVVLAKPLSISALTAVDGAGTATAPVTKLAGSPLAETTSLTTMTAVGTAAPLTSDASGLRALTRVTPATIDSAAAAPSGGAVEATFSTAAAAADDSSLAAAPAAGETGTIVIDWVAPPAAFAAAPSNSATASLLADDWRTAFVGNLAVARGLSAANRALRLTA